MDAESLVELFAPLGPVRVKRMFGGKGIYLDGLIIAVELSDGTLYLKGDGASAPAYEAAGGRRWVHEGETKAGKPRAVAMPYWTMPDVAFDDEEALRRFGGLARDASRRAGPAKAKRVDKREKSSMISEAKTS